MFLLKRKTLHKFKSTLYWLMKGPYKPQKFWDKWAENFIHEPMQQARYSEHSWILKTLLREKPATLLEVGCGFGRNIKFIAEKYPYPLTITGVDFSRTMLKNAEAYLASLDPKKTSIKLQQADVLDLPFSPSSFDVVLSHGVLMHIQPNNINKALKELLRVTKKALILVEQNDTMNPLNEKPFKKINYFTFTYPYKKLLQETGVRIIEYQRTKQLDWFLIHALHKRKKL